MYSHRHRIFIAFFQIIVFFLQLAAADPDLKGKSQGLGLVWGD